MVELARTRLPQAGKRLVVGRIEQLPFGEGSFDAAVSTGTLGYLDDPEAALRELARVVRPGGTVVISFGNARSPHRLWRRFRPSRWPDVPRRRVVTLGRLKAMLATAGLEVETVDRAGFAVLPVFLSRRFPVAAARLARAAGRKRSPARALAAMLFVVSARKPDQAQDSR